VIAILDERLRIERDLADCVEARPRGGRGVSSIVT
jgi:hypothetical protein